MRRTSRRHAAIVLAVSAALTLALGPVSAGGPAVPSGDGYQLYFGDLHAHTSYSDGARGTTPADAFEAARLAGADFMATTDHQGSLTSTAWAATLADAAAANAAYPGEFVAMPGYEAWVVGIGEINVFNTPDWPKGPTGRGADKANSGHHGNRWLSLPEMYDWLAEEPGAVGQWNHPTAYAGVSSEDFTGYAGWSEARDAGMGMIEVFNDVVYESSYVAALDAGWHVMPTANSDTHAADWIKGSDVRTVLLAPSLTPADLYAAMRAGRGYATLDKNLEVRFSVDGAMMGSLLDAPPAAVTVRVRVDDPDAAAEDEVTRIEIVTDGGVVLASQPVSGTSVDWNADIDASTARYLYARVSTASGVDGLPGPTAWTAPVWTGR
jgi:hypothetical protein